MNCPKCRKPMSSYVCEGKSINACHACGEVSGETIRVQHQTASPAIVGAGRGVPSEGEATFSEVWRELHPTLPFAAEYLFCLTRDWRVDFAWPAEKVAVEVESSVHRTKGRFETDIPKYNALTSEGWALFRCTRGMLSKNEERFCRMVAETIRRREKCLNG